MRFIERKRLTSGVNPLMKRAFRTAILSLTFAIAPQAPSTWTTAQATPVETSSTSDPLRPHAESKDFNGRYGYVLMNAKTGEILEKRDADHPFIPASLAKIPTLSMAMNALGMKHRFETRVLADGQIEQGVLYGNLHLVGSGDPTLKTRDLKALSDTLAQQGITRITGDFTFNTDALPRSPAIDKTLPTADYYNPAVSGLNLDLNLWRSGGVRKKVTSPGYHTARLFRDAVARHGINLPMPKHASGNAPGKIVARHLSAPVSEIAKAMMENSTNLTAEALGVLSISATGTQPASLKDAAKVTTDWIKDSVRSNGGVDWSGFILANHSGLTTKSQATPRQIASILHHGFETYGETYRAMHPAHSTGGYQAFDMRGKIGSMRFVRGYAGFLSIGNHELIFAIMLNDEKQRALADAGRRGLPSDVWMKNALKLEQAILGDWIESYWPSGSDEEATETSSTTSEQPITSNLEQTPTESASDVQTLHVMPDSHVRASDPVE